MLLFLGFAAVTAALLGAYVVRVLAKGRFDHDRARKEPGSAFLGRFLIEFGYWCFSPLEKACHSLGITPNQLTIGSLASSLLGAAAFALGSPEAGGALVILCAILDALDGMVARTRGTASEAGELLDAAVDRYAEIATFAGIAAYYRSYAPGFWLALASMGGALLVSYARAKGEISGIDARMGAMNRGERAMYIGMAGLVAPVVAHFVEPGARHPQYHALLAVMILIATMANVTALRRFAYVHAQLRQREPRREVQPTDPLAGWMHRAWVASAVATAIDYGTFTVLVEIAGVYTGTSRALGALLGAVANFTVNKLWTFRTSDESVWHEAPRYAAISLTSLLLNTLGVVLLTDGLRWNPLVAAGFVGVLVAVCWNLPLHRHFVFRHGAAPSRPGLALLGAMASATAAIAVLFVAYRMPFAQEAVHGFSAQADDGGHLSIESFLPKLRPDPFYSESYSFLFSGDDGTFARVQFLVSNAGLEGHGKAAARAIVVGADGSAVEDTDTFEDGRWSVLPEGAIEMGAHRLTMGPDASHHVHFAGRKLVLDATVLPETKAVRPGGGRVVFDSGGRAVFDQTIFALRSKFDGTVWTAKRGNRKLRGYCYADTSYTTVPAYKSASLWFRMEAFDDGAGGTAALAVLLPPEGALTEPQGWFYTSKNGNTEVRSTEVKLSFEDARREPGGRFEYDVPRRIVAVAKGAAGETATVTLEARRLLYKEDVLGEMGPLSRLLVSTVAAPMAYTYEDKYQLVIERPGEAPEKREGTALTEFSYASKPAPMAGL
jgi:phosphatidylglycerophosphate synthase/putative flippase GtrA